MAKIRLSIAQSAGSYLKGSNVKQLSFPCIEITSDDNKAMIEVALTFDQLAQFFCTSSDITCTLQHYFGPNGIEKDVVEPPPSISQQAENAFGEVSTKLNERIKSLHDKVYDLLNSRKAGKNDLKDVLMDISTIKDNYLANHGYLFAKTQEEIENMKENAITQISVFLQKLGADPKLGKTFEQPRLANPEEAVAPTIIEPSDYVRKERDPEKMTNLELADNIHKELKRLEKVVFANETVSLEKRKYGTFYESQATESPKGVYIVYISFHGATLIPPDVAVRYLKFLKTVDTKEKFKTHYWFERKQ